MTIAETMPRVEAKGHAGVGLLGIGTATPPSVPQGLIDQLAQGFACDTEQHRSFHGRVFARSGVEARGSVLVQGSAAEDLQGFYPPRKTAEDRGPTTGARMACYAREAPRLAEVAAGRALGDAGVAAGAITHLVTVSCTGFVAPGLDVALIERLQLSPGVRRTHIGFMGCHAAFNALGLARTMVLADPEAVVLVCCVELCTLHFAYGWDPERLVANALFADGAAAAVVGHGGEAGSAGRWQLRDTASLLVPGSQGAMTWTIGDHGYEMTLSAELPNLVRGNLRGWCDGWLGRHGMTVGEVQSWAIHPGGPKILDAAEAALGVGREATGASRQILAAHGNMSSTTVLFVLQQLARVDAAGPCVALGFGPGLMMEGMLLER